MFVEYLLILLSKQVELEHFVFKKLFDDIERQ
jgi:hypothetical protein